MNIVELTLRLKKHGILTSEWGTGKAKTVQDLLEELELGESRLDEVLGVLTRFVEVCAINVYATFGASRKRLVEVKQQFVDGRVRVRKLDTSLGEKLLPDELPHDTAIRALAEELKIQERLHLVPRQEKREGPRATDSYPGLPSVYLFHRFDVYLPDHLVQSSGYVVKEDRKTVHYEWQ